jgi:hypothetical protein
LLVLQRDVAILSMLPLHCASNGTTEHLLVV